MADHRRHERDLEFGNSAYERLALGGAPASGTTLLLNLRKISCVKGMALVINNPGK